MGTCLCMAGRSALVNFGSRLLLEVKAGAALIAAVMSTAPKSARDSGATSPQLSVPGRRNGGRPRIDAGSSRIDGSPTWLTNEVRKAPRYGLVSAVDDSANRPNSAGDTDVSGWGAA